MTLIEFLEDMSEELEKFHKVWHTGQKENPNDYPLELSREDWEKQFIAEVFEILV